MDRITDIRQPRHQLFQQVRVVSEVENGVMENTGFVVGLYVDIEISTEPSWFYHVMYFALPLESWLKTPYIDPGVPESEIYPIEQHNEPE